MHINSHCHLCIYMHMHADTDPEINQGGDWLRFQAVSFMVTYIS